MAQLIRYQKAQHPVVSPSPGWPDMGMRWALVDTLLDGTLAIRDKQEQYLPRHEKESITKYRKRLKRSVLMPAYRSALELAVSRPFSKPVTYTGTLPTDLEQFWLRTDQQGHDMTGFARRWFMMGLHYGLCHALVDSPSTMASNLEEERELGVMPRAHLIKPTDLFGWRFTRSDAHGMQLTQIRFFEHRVVDSGTYGEKEQTTVKVINVDPESEGPGEWQRWTLMGKNEADQTWVMTEVGVFDYPEIPLVTFYGQQTAPMLGKPPFEHLAHLNVQHYQSDSEQKDLLQFARVGVWFAKGWSKAELQKGLTIGAHRFVGSENPNATLQVVEHSGSALNMGMADIDRIEARMQMVAHDVISRAPSGDMRATTAVVGERRQESQIGAWTQDMNEALLHLTRHAGQWRNLEVPDDFRPQVFSDFVVGLRGDADVGQLHQMRANQDLSRQSYYEELQRRGFLSDMVTVEEEERRLEDEQLNLPRAPVPTPPPEAFGDGVPDLDDDPNAGDMNELDRDAMATE